MLRRPARPGVIRMQTSGRHKSGAAQVLRSVGTAPVVEEHALAALYREHATAVRAFVRAQLPDPDRTEDVVQETFLRAWRQIARMDLAGGNPRSYLFTTARNILTDSWRAQSRRPRMVDDEQQPATAPSEDQVEAVLEALTINEAPGRLSVEHSEVPMPLRRPCASCRLRRDGDPAMTEDVHLPLGADVLGGLNAAERRAFEDHIDGCSRCRTELAELVPVAALLGRVAAVPATWGATTAPSSRPPPGVR
ncbi:MAG TPA: sigma-70 family RNA polymerase sigma factor [Actinopolymorphaceae bacterium]